VDRAKRVTDVLRSIQLQNLGIAHGFNLRSGGLSAGPFASFNLGRGVGDEPMRVQENRERFARAVSFPENALYEVSQVHGSSIHRVVPGVALEVVREIPADGLLAVGAGLAIAVRSADCVPILLADPQTGAVAALHAGWRGVVAGVVQAGVASLRAARRGEGVGRSAIVAAIFPHIRRCCFEVGTDVAEALAAASSDRAVVDRTGNKPHVDLTRAVLAQLVGAGIERAHIDDVAGCTCCEPARFFSYRRDGASSGRHLTAIISR
jgi:YfiH family protein